MSLPDGPGLRRLRAALGMPTRRSLRATASSRRVGAILAVIPPRKTNAPAATAPSARRNRTARPMAMTLTLTLGWEPAPDRPRADEARRRGPPGDHPPLRGQEPPHRSAPW